ncbi:putative GATA transcription factor 22 isoform X2 [Iris pallida]|uniref:GATA transcription factor 22 isoform X2 n=1 Tax=Iris pallida TaxID=29817 RepID=A0AAX6FI92_IRIPA|nr:putative GATA transcription factor 22 isoform X2 [Iris pallida]
MKEDQDQDISNISYDASQQEQVAIPREQLFGQQEREPYDHRLSIFNREERAHEELVPVKWMSSKIRLMRKMMGEDRISLTKQTSQVPQDHQAHSNGSNPPTPTAGIVRACSNCNTTKTPLWRSGPQGPKSLCNACGIRQMKARRAMRAAAAAAAAVGGGLVPAGTAPPPVKVAKERSEADRTVPFKKRFKIAAAPSSATKRLRFDDVKFTPSKKKMAFNQAFPQEEKDAAILLMALSCGLIHG